MYIAGSLSTLSFIENNNTHRLLFLESHIDDLQELGNKFKLFVSIQKFAEDNKQALVISNQDLNFEHIFPDSWFTIGINDDNSFEKRVNKFFQSIRKDEFLYPIADYNFSKIDKYYFTIKKV